MRLSWLAREISATFPKSTYAMSPEGSASTFPGCGSPWNKPKSSSCRKPLSTPFCRNTRRASGLSNAPSAVHRTPSCQSITSTRGEESDWYTPGICTASSSAKLRLKSRRLSASWLKSSSSSSFSANSSTSSVAGHPRFVLAKSSKNISAAARRMNKSRITCGLVPGRRIFTATSAPPSSGTSVALYTCPMLAAATGSGVMVANTAFTSRPASSRMMSNASPVGKGGTRSCSRVSSSIRSSSTRSGRFARFCPSFTNSGPRLVRASLNAVAYRAPPSVLSNCVMASFFANNEEKVENTFAPSRRAPTGCEAPPAESPRGRTDAPCGKNRSPSRASPCAPPRTAPSCSSSWRASDGGAARRGGGVDENPSGLADAPEPAPESGLAEVSASVSVTSGSAMAPGTRGRGARRGGARGARDKTRVEANESRTRGAHGAGGARNRAFAPARRERRARARRRHCRGRRHRERSPTGGEGEAGADASGEYPRKRDKTCVLVTPLSLPTRRLERPTPNLHLHPLFFFFPGNARV